MNFYELGRDAVLKQQGRKVTRALPLRLAREQAEEGALALRRRLVDAPGAVAASQDGLQRLVRLVPGRVAERGPEALAANRVGTRRGHAVEAAREEVCGVFNEAGQPFQHDDVEAARAVAVEREPEVIGDEVFEGVDRDRLRRARTRLRRVGPLRLRRRV